MAAATTVQGAVSDAVNSASKDISAAKDKIAQDFLPLAQSTYFILASLLLGEKHGYAISQEIEALSEGTVRLGVGNLYVSLHDLMKAGLIERAGERKENGRVRKYYRLCGLGEKVLRLENLRLQRMVRALPTHAVGLGRGT
jgi:DNA-binding PadR family transcriptional regulator